MTSIPATDPARPDSGQPLGAGIWLGPRYLAATAVATALVALALGIPTDIVPNPWFVRMTPPGFSNYFFWVTSSMLVGALAATYILPRIGRDTVVYSGTGSGILGSLAVGCPICNKLVVALLGVSGALNYFAPIQPLLGAAGLALASVALVVRLRGARRACALDARVGTAGQTG
jgi:predicted membrane protein